MDEIERMKKEIGEKIKEKREKINLSQEQLAEKLGYKSKTSIHKVEQGMTDLPQSKIIEFAKALNTSPAYLMGWIDEKAEDNKIYDITLPDGKTFEFKEKDGKISMFMKEPNSSVWQEFQFDNYEQQEFEKVRDMNMLFFKGKQVAPEDKFELEKTLLTIFIKAYFNHKK